LAEKFYRKEKDIIVINADTMLDINLKQLINFHLHESNDITICLATVLDVSNYGHIVLGNENRIELFAEKLKNLHIAGVINGGIYIIKKKIMEDLAPGEVVSFEREVFPSLISLNRKICGFKSSGIFIDISTLSGYQQTKDKIKHFKLNI
jgi:mannose-1-phosphate guanylyltransferase